LSHPSDDFRTGAVATRAASTGQLRLPAICRLTVHADEIILGTITDVHDETFQLEVKETVVGSLATSKQLSVRQFHDWPCAWRWGKYAVGERVLLFLEKDAEQWHIIGAGNEGEILVQETHVLTNFAINGKKVEVDGRMGLHCFTAVDYFKLRDAIRDLHKTFRFKLSTNVVQLTPDGYADYVPFERIERLAPYRGKFRPRRPQPKYEDRSAVHRYLAELVHAEQEFIEDLRLKRARQGNLADSD
jgi:hypothetical protein